MTASAKGSKKEKKEEPSDERVRVVVRIRPPIRKDEMYGEGSEALQVDKERNLLFLLQKEGQGVTEKTKQFVFDRVLWKDSEQVRVRARARARARAKARARVRVRVRVTLTLFDRCGRTRSRLGLGVGLGFGVRVRVRGRLHRAGH